MRTRTMVLPALLAAAALMFAIPVAAIAADQTQTRSMDQDQMYSLSGSGSAEAAQYRETHIWAEQTANMGDTSQVKAGDPKKETEKRGETLGSGESDAAKKGGGDGSGGSGGGSKK